MQIELTEPEKMALEKVQQKLGLASLTETANYLFKAHLNPFKQKLMNGRRTQQQAARALQVKTCPRRTMCPHCKQYASFVKSVVFNPLYKEITFRCENHQCGHIFLASLEVTRTISLSATPDASINLPLSDKMQKKLLNQAKEESNHVDV